MMMLLLLLRMILLLLPLTPVRAPFARCVIDHRLRKVLEISGLNTFLGIPNVEMQLSHFFCHCCLTRWTGSLALDLEVPRLLLLLHAVLEFKPENFMRTLRRTVCGCV